MAHFFFSFDLQLHYPFATALVPGDEQFYVYFSQVDLNGSTMPVVIPVAVNESPVTPFYTHGTCRRVMGAADVVGDTIFMKLPTLSTSGGQEGVYPTTMFQAEVAMCEVGAFRATIPGGKSWPPAVDAKCTYHPNNAQVGGLADRDTAVFTGKLVGFEDGVLTVDVHTMHSEGNIPAYDPRGKYYYSLSLAQQKAIFNWLRIYRSVCAEEDLADDPARRLALKNTLAAQDDGECNPPVALSTRSPTPPRDDTPGSPSSSSTASLAGASKMHNLGVQDMDETSLSLQLVGVSHDVEARMPAHLRVRSASI